MQLMQAKEGPLQLVGRRQSVLLWQRKDDQNRVDEEDQLSAWAQEPGRLGNPCVRVAPDAGAVLGDHQVERGVIEWRSLCVGVHEREGLAKFVLQPPRGGELGGRIVQANW